MFYTPCLLINLIYLDESCNSVCGKRVGLFWGRIVRGCYQVAVNSPAARETVLLLKGHFTRQKLLVYVYEP